MFMMAAEKMMTVICSLEQMLEFSKEHGIKCEEAVKKELEPLIEQLRSWIDAK